MSFYDTYISSNYDASPNTLNPFCYHPELADNDTYTFKDMLTQPDKNNVFEAMEVEITNYTERDHWDLISRSQLPSGSKKIIPVWSFKRKRLPDGTICKYKARICVHDGYQQWGVDYWETYAPVVQ